MKYKPYKIQILIKNFPVVNDTHSKLYHPYSLPVCGVLTVDNQTACIGDGDMQDLTLESLPRYESVNVVAMSHSVQETCAILGPTDGQV